MQLQENPCVCCAVVLLVSPPKTQRRSRDSLALLAKFTHFGQLLGGTRLPYKAEGKGCWNEGWSVGISWTIAFYVSWNPFNDLEVFENYPPYPCNTLTHAKLQHLGIKIQLNLTSANARLQKGLGTKVLAVPDRWLPSWVRNMQVKESILDIFRCSPKMPKKGVQLLIVTLSSADFLMFRVSKPRSWTSSAWL